MHDTPKNNLPFRQELDQSLCDQYLICPRCLSEKKLECRADEMVCRNCTFKTGLKFGIPCLMNREDVGNKSSRFLGFVDEREEFKTPHKGQKLHVLRRVIGQEIIHLLNVIYFAYKLGPRKLTKRYFGKEVESAVYYRKKSYMILLLKALEKYHFGNMKKYIASPSMEIGPANNTTTNLIFRDTIESITFGCQYFMDSFLNEVGELDDEMYKVIKYYVGGSIKPFPFRSNSFKALIAVHIIDHVIDLDQWLKETHRILEPGGHIIMSGLSKYHFDNFPGVKFRSIFSRKWAKKYKEWRIKKPNPRGGILQSDFEYDATGQNLLSIEEWRDISNEYGFEIVEHAFYGKYFSYLQDIEYRGYFNSYFFTLFIYSAISEMIEKEKQRTLPERESSHVILVLRKKSDEYV